MTYKIRFPKLTHTKAGENFIRHVDRNFHDYKLLYIAALMLILTSGIAMYCTPIP